MSEEFNWFEFETRMRRLVVELLEPTVRKTTEDRELLQDLKWKSEYSHKNLKTFESLLGFGDNKSGWIEDIDKKVIEILMRLSELEQKFTNSLQTLNCSLDAKTVEVCTIFNRLEGIHERNIEIDKHLTHLNESHVSQSVITKEFLEKYKQDFSEKYNIMIQETTNSQTKSDNINHRLSDVINKLNDFQKVLDRQRYMINDLNANLQKCTNEKISHQELFNESQFLNSKISVISEKSLKNSFGIEEILKYLNVYLPLEIQTSVSESIFSFANEKSLRKFCEYQEILFSDALISENHNISDIIKRSEGGNARILKKHKDLMYKLNKKSKTSKYLEESPIKGLNNIPNKDDQVDSNVFSRKNSILEPNIVEVYLMHEKFGLVNEQIKKLREEVFSSQEQTKIFLDIQKKEWEGFIDRISEDHQKVKKEYAEFCKEINFSLAPHTKYIDEMKSLKNLCKNLTEVTLIVYHLLSQDEEDKKSIHVYGYKEKNKESKNETEQEKFQHFAPVLSQNFKNACLSYNPTPLYYREIVYQRHDLIEHMGNIIKTAWIKAGQKIEFKEVKREEKQKPKNLGSRISLSFTSRKKIRSIG